MEVASYFDARMIPENATEFIWNYAFNDQEWKHKKKTLYPQMRTCPSEAANTLGCDYTRPSEATNTWGTNRNIIQ